MSKQDHGAPPDTKVEEPRTFTFNFTHPIKIVVHDKPQSSQDGRTFRVELATDGGPALMAYSEFIRFAQTVATLLDPRALVE